MDLGLDLTFPRQQQGQLGLSLLARTPSVQARSYRAGSPGCPRGGTIGLSVETMPRGLE